MRIPAVRISARRALLALLLAAALLVCHGLLGASHAIAHGEPPASERQVGHSSASHEGSGHAAGEQTAGADETVAHVGATDHFAVLLALLGAAALGLVRVSVRGPLVREAPRAFRPYPGFANGSPPRGPSLPLLQVFRL